MIRKSGPEASEPLLEQAAIWFQRMSLGESSTEHQGEFEIWRNARASHAAAYAQIENAHATSKSMGDRNEILALRHETLARLAMPKRRRMLPALAAGLALILVGSTTFAVWKYQPASHDPVIGIVAKAPGVYETAVGERLSVALADGSNLVLNTASRVRVAYTDRERRLVLERGQALFEVAKGRKRPFVVLAGGKMITAKGTSFDVRLDGQNAVKITLIEGLVTVASTNNPKRLTTKLRPSEVMLATASQEVISRIDEIESVTSWREGLVIFEDDSLVEAVAEMNRYVRQPIALGDEQLKTVRVSGAFRTGETAAFIEALRMSFPIEVSEWSDRRIVLTTRT